MKYQQIKISTPDEDYFSWVRRGIIEEAEIEYVKRAKGREELKRCEKKLQKINIR